MGIFLSFPASAHTRIRTTVVVVGALLLSATPALATFHLSHIERLMTGLGGNTAVQYVEIQMDFASQIQVGGSKLIAFGADGSFDHVVLTVASNITGSGTGKYWIMASSAFQAASGIAPDFVFDSSAGKGLPAENGMVCWGKPTDQTNPNSTDMIDCVSYGNYTGASNSHTGVPSAIKPFGHGLMRTSQSHSSFADFVCEAPAVPHNNAQTAGNIVATSPCVGCGNGVVDPGETCDDGNPAFAAGDFCSAACKAFPCGIPTKVDGATPKISDALFVLRAAVQIQNCDVRVCDVNNSGTITVADALIVLRIAVGQQLQLHCHA